MKYEFNLITIKTVVTNSDHVTLGNLSEQGWEIKAVIVCNWEYTNVLLQREVTQ